MTSAQEQPCPPPPFSPTLVASAHRHLRATTSPPDPAAPATPPKPDSAAAGAPLAFPAVAPSSVRTDRTSGRWRNRCMCDRTCQVFIGRGRRTTGNSESQQSGLEKQQRGKRGARFESKQALKLPTGLDSYDIAYRTKETEHFESQQALNVANRPR